MKVWVVLATTQYEGDDLDSVWSSEIRAQAHADKLNSDRSSFMAYYRVYAEEVHD